ncbi:MAG: hypothetical protein IT365_00870 [Candidatus Hydrogenedentes bacterium]|nr:hypothetical protein [Candidatus Hydrogenedentota bacterium]
MEQEEELVIVFAGAIGDADFARSVLEGHGFTPYMSDEALGTWAPFYASPGGAGAVKVAVPQSQAEAARALLETPGETGGDQE